MKASLKPGSATNRTIAAKKRKADRLSSEIKQLYQALDYVESWGSDRATPF